MPYGSRARLAVSALLLFSSGRASWVEARRKPVPQTVETAGSTLDFETYRTRIEPIFLKQRDNGVRCYDCHSKLVTRLRLEPLSEGSSAWTAEQSRKNFSFVVQLVTPGIPLESRLLLHPLAPSAGGDPAHTGGKFWQAQSDPEWQMISEWVRHATTATPARSISVVDAATIRAVAVIPVGEVPKRINTLVLLP
jgi:hypothetical protein